MADPLSGPKAGDGSTLAKFKLRLAQAIRDRVPKEQADNLLSPTPGVFDKPSTTIKGALKFGREFQHIIDSLAYSGAEAAGVKNVEMKVTDFEAKKVLGKIFGGPSVKIADEIIGSKTSSGDELPRAIKVLTPDGRTVFFRPGDRERLAAINAQRAREGRPLLPSPLAPSATYSKPTITPLPSASAPPVAHPAPSTLPITEQPKPQPFDKQAPAKPLLIAFVDP